MAFRELPMNINDHSNLDWQAFCYAAGELDASAAVQFEARLAIEQPAREALARAVELTQTIAASEVQSEQIAVATKRSLARQSPRNSTYHRAWLTLAAAALVLFALQLSGVLDLTTRMPHGPSPIQAQLAHAWTATRNHVADDASSEIWSDFDLPPDADELGESEFSQEDSDLAEAPSWMLAAVYARSVSTDSPSTERLEN